MMSHTLRANLFIVCTVFLHLTGAVFANEIKGRCERYHLPDDGKCAASVNYPGDSIRISSVYLLVGPHEDPYFLLAFMIGVDENDPNYQSMEDKEVTQCTQGGGVGDVCCVIEEWCRTKLNAIHTYVFDR